MTCLAVPLRQQLRPRELCYIKRERTYPSSMTNKALLIISHDITQLTGSKTTNRRAVQDVGLQISLHFATNLRTAQLRELGAACTWAGVVTLPQNYVKLNIHEAPIEKLQPFRCSCRIRFDPKRLNIRKFRNHEKKGAVKWCFIYF